MIPAALRDRTAARATFAVSMDWVARILRHTTESRTRLLVSAVAGEVLALALLHHLRNVWGLPWYTPIAALWLAYGLLQLWLSSYRRPARIWLSLAIITVVVLLLPTILGLVSWRYLMPGFSLLTPMALASSDTLGRFGGHWLNRARLLA
jgi:hypothetical protein